MNPRDERAKLETFVESLPEKVFSFLLDKKLELNILPIDIAAKYELTLNETGGICEGVRRVLAGEDSPSNLAAFISQDKNIEEDNRGKITQIAQEIQQKIFDVVLPIFRQTGLPVKDGRVPTPSPVSPLERGKGEASAAQPISPISPIRPIGPIGQMRPTAPPLTPPLGKGEERVRVESASSPRGVSVPVDERHLRALLRIAAGTNYTEEKLREAFEDLPEGLKRAIVSVDTANAVQEIAKKFLLHVDQMAALASETGLVLLGLTHPREFVRNLAARLRVSEQRALEIAKEVSGQVLVKVREALRTLHESAENPKSDLPAETSAQAGIRNPKPTQGVVPAEAGNQSSLDSRIRGNDRGEDKLNAKRYPLNASLNTPYSPEAKWKTEDEQRTREEMLRDIESPTLNAERYPPAGGLNASPVGPTGWRPSQRASSVERLAFSERKDATAQTPKPQTPPPPTPPSVPPHAPTTPQPPPLKGGEGEPDLIERNLSGPAASAPEIKRYTIDPYREPLQ